MALADVYRRLKGKEAVWSHSESNGGEKP